jgi:putative membrane protein
MNFICNFFIGILIGCGAILPGISAGVFCVIFGIYEKLINSITSLLKFKDFKKNFMFLLPIVLGCFIGIVLFGNIIKILFTKFENEARFIFLGLILGTIPSLFKQASQKNPQSNGFYVLNIKNRN